MARVIVLESGFGIEKLKQIERPRPQPARGEILLRMRAQSLNYRDLLVVNGLYNPRQKLPLVPLSDGVGEVVELGPGASRFRVGQRVCPIFCQSWISGPQEPGAGASCLGSPLDGTLREWMAISEDGAVAVPDLLSDTEAASLPCAAVTAWNAVVERGRIKAGDRVLVQGSGGVSVFSLIFARSLGATVLATSGSEEKRERLRELGAKETVNYRETPEWGDRIREMAGGDGVDLVVEVGGAGTLPESLKAAKTGGQIAVIGVLSGFAEPLNILPVLMRGLRLQGIFVGSRSMFEDMLRAMESLKLRPPVGQVFEFEEAAQALKLMASAQHFAKICLKMD